MATTTRRPTASTDKRRHPSAGIFKPKFPIDPFAAADVREPWFIRPDALPPSSAHPRRDVILVLGSPTTKDLDAFLFAKHLSNSLLIIATHLPPNIPHNTLPAVRILRLQESLAIEHAGAVRFVNVLEWAERVARLWRKYGGYGAVELAEDSDGQEHLPAPSILRFRGSQSTPPSPLSSASNLCSRPESSLLTPDYQPTDRPRSVSSRIFRTRHVSLPPVDPSQRPFDGLINFLPPSVSDKAMLKQAILVTTISRPFLIASAPRSEDRTRRRSRFSSWSATSVYLPSPSPLQSKESLWSMTLVASRAHLIHVLPLETHSFPKSAKAKLVQSLEGFLLSFGYPASFDHKGPPDYTDRPRPFIMTPSSLSETISPSPSASLTASPYGSWPSDYSLAELVLYGTLDGEDGGCHSHATQAKQLTRSAPRALLSRASDVVILAEDSPAPPTVLVSPSDVPLPKSEGLYMPTNPGKYARETSFSSMTTSSLNQPSTPMSRSVSPGSPLAKRDQYANLSYLPTPPDSDESSAENGPVDAQLLSKTQVLSASPTNVPVTQDAHDHQSKARKTRWKFNFWRRSVAAIS